MNKVLAFYGAFNPPTIAHVKLAKLAMDVTGYGGTIFVPSKASYIVEDQHKDFAFSDDARIDMLRKICESHRGFTYSTMDIDSETQPCTYDSLVKLDKMLDERYGEKLTLLIGADQLFDMDKHWKYVDKIAKEFGVVVLCRRAFSIGSILERPFFKDIKQYFRAIETPGNMKNISSSYIRNELFEAQELIENMREALTPEIYEYIKEHYLYEI